MTVVETDAWDAAGGKTAGTTGDGAGDSTDDGTLVSVGELELGKGKIRIIGGALPTPTETNDHRFGLRNYAPTFSGLFIMENSLKHDSPVLGRTALTASQLRAQRTDLRCANQRASVAARRGAPRLTGACAAALK